MIDMNFTRLTVESLLMKANIQLYEMHCSNCGASAFIRIQGTVFICNRCNCVVSNPKDAKLAKKGEIDEVDKLE